MPSADEVKSAFRQYNVNGEDGTPQTPTANQLAYYTGSPWTKLLDDLLHYVADRETREVTASNGVNSTLQAQLDSLRQEYNTLKVLKAQEQATPDVPPVPSVVPVVINDPLPPQPMPNLPSTLSTPLKVAIGAVVALLIALAAWIH